MTKLHANQQWDKAVSSWRSWCGVRHCVNSLVSLAPLQRRARAGPGKPRPPLRGRADPARGPGGAGVTDWSVRSYRSGPGETATDPHSGTRDSLLTLEHPGPARGRRAGGPGPGPTPAAGAGRDS